jgi:S-adenosylmethionine decarboxylase
LPTIYLSWHAYPEVNLLALDIFMCGSARPQLALARIKDFWQPKTIDIQHMKRGTVASHKLPAEIASQLT